MKRIAIKLVAVSVLVLATVALCISPDPAQAQNCGYHCNYIPQLGGYACDTEFGQVPNYHECVIVGDDFRNPDYCYTDYSSPNCP